MLFRLEKYKMIKSKKFFKNKSLLITGGTGSLGNAIIDYVVKHKIDFKRIIIFSRDELKQYNLREKLNKKILDKIRFFIGDIRDKERLSFALQNIDIVIHAAALKQVPASEYNPFEFIKTNILGAQNLVDACLQNNVTNVVALSTDKASSPVNLYGATKLCSDKIFTSAQNMIGKKKITFSVVRYGNVFGSRGSVWPKFKSLKSNETFPVTHPKMTRFNISLNQSVELILNSLLMQKGGEIFVPKLASYRLLDLCKAIDKNRKIKFTGIRPGEKIHEELISISESRLTIERNNFFIILPANKKTPEISLNYNLKKIKFPKKDFIYNSGSNKNFLSILQLKKIIKNYEDQVN
jgi:UDP-N-acetylglucosamine 4,6-dehydratase (inverting)